MAGPVVKDLVDLVLEYEGVAPEFENGVDDKASNFLEEQMANRIWNEASKEYSGSAYQTGQPSFYTTGANPPWY